MFLLGEEHCLALAAELDPVVHGDRRLADAAAVLARHARPELVRGIVHEGLKAAAATVREGFLFRGGLVNIANGPNYSLDLRYAFDVKGDDMEPTGSRRHLLARAADVIIANVGPKTLEGTGYKLAAPANFDIFDPDATLEPSGDWHLAPGEALIVKGGEQVTLIANAIGARFLSLSLAPRWSLDWIFDRETLRPLTRSVAHIDDSQFITCLEAAAWLRDADTESAVTALTGHRAHFVRWKAVQALGTLNPSAALPLIVEAATHDLHPSVRKAARATLAQIQQPSRAGR
jgi:hypothetical protein